jgi:hypothetical protein
MVRCHTLLSLREPGRRAQFLNAQLKRLDELIVPLVTARAPSSASLNAGRRFRPCATL